MIKEKIKELGYKYNRKKDLYIPKDNISVFCRKKSRTHKTLSKCYKYPEKSVKFKDIEYTVVTENSVEILLINDELGYNLEYIEIGLGILGKNSDFYIPEKFIPLMIHNQEIDWIFYIAPIIAYYLDWAIACNPRRTFKEATGCICPVIINKQPTRSE